MKTSRLAHKAFQEVTQAYRQEACGRAMWCEYFGSQIVWLSFNLDDVTLQSDGPISITKAL